jgi:hypothetical protein
MFGDQWRRRELNGDRALRPSPSSLHGDLSILEWRCQRLVIHHSPPFCRCHWTIWAGFLAGPRVLDHLFDNLLERLHSGDFFHAEPLEIRREGAHQRSFVAVQLSQCFRVLPGFLIVRDDALDGLIECDQQRRRRTRESAIPHRGHRAGYQWPAISSCSSCNWSCGLCLGAVQSPRHRWALVNEDSGNRGFDS